MEKSATSERENAATPKMATCSCPEKGCSYAEALDGGEGARRWRRIRRHWRGGGL